MSIIDAAILLLFGLGIGVFGTLIGVGGGFLAVPLLLVVYHVEPGLAAGTSLLFVFLNALSGTLAYLKQRRVDLRAGLIFAVMTFPGAVGGAYVTSYLGHSIFRLLFATLLFGFSIHLITRTSTLESDSTAKMAHLTSRGYQPNLKLGSGLSVAIGFFSSIFGIGGGVIHVPAMVAWLGFPIHVATATALFILTFTSLFGWLTHYSLGHVDLYTGLIMGSGALIGAQLGAIISRQMKSVVIRKLLAIALALVALRLVLEAL